MEELHTNFSLLLGLHHQFKLLQPLGVLSNEILLDQLLASPNIVLGHLQT